MDAFLRIAGTLIVLIALVDVFFTVLFPASGHGPVRKPSPAGSGRPSG